MGHYYICRAVNAIWHSVNPITKEKLSKYTIGLTIKSHVLSSLAWLGISNNQLVILKRHPPYMVSSIFAK